MKKKNTNQPNYRTRTAVPRMTQDDKGHALLWCPFCNPTHLLSPSKPALCGTLLILTAEQTIIRSKYEKNMVCVKCGKGGGEMVMFQNAFVHLEDCTPGVMAMTEPPVYSRVASFVHAIKNDWVKQTVEKITGQAMSVDEVLPDGTRTGVVLGHFFNKKVTHGKQTPTHS